MSRVTETRRQVQPGAVAPGCGHRPAPAGDDDEIGVDGAGGRVDQPSVIASSHVGQPRLESKLHARTVGFREQPIADIASAIGDGKVLTGVRLELERDAQIAFKERTLFFERPRFEQTADQRARGVADKSFGLDGARQHVASPAAADEDFSSAIARRLEDDHAVAARRGENRRHQTGRARAGHQNSTHRLSSLIRYAGGPMFSSRLPAALAPNAITRARASLRARGIKLIDLTETNPTSVGLSYPPDVLAPLASADARRYAPDSLGMPSARVAIARDYARTGVSVRGDQIMLTASTSEAYALSFKLLCNPDDEVLVPQPSYPLFESLTMLEAVRARPYRLDAHGHWS